MAAVWNLPSVLAERLRRQGLSAPLPSMSGYRELFARLQPVAPIASTRPGDPPRLVHRTIPDDGPETDRLRARREIVKGRFLGGTVGYVLASDLALYANAFQRPLTGLTTVQEQVLTTVRHEGPVTAHQIKAATDLLSKQIMPALHRLQEAWLVYEDQVDDDWERGWYDFASEWPAAVVRPDLWETATAAVLRRWLQAQLFATAEQLADWSGLAARRLAGVLAGLERDGQIVPRSVDGLGDGYCEADERPPADDMPPPGVFMLHKADPLLRAHASEIKARFGNQEALQYLLIDGRFSGAVLGHWRIGPHDVDDIALTLPAAERAARRAEIIRAVAWVYGPPHSQIVRYDGQPLA